MQAVGIGEGVKEEKVLETSVGETLTIRFGKTEPGARSTFRRMIPKHWRCSTTNTNAALVTATMPSTRANGLRVPRAEARRPPARVREADGLEVHPEDRRSTPSRWRVRTQCLPETRACLILLLSTIPFYGSRGPCLGRRPWLSVRRRRLRAHSGLRRAPIPFDGASRPPRAERPVPWRFPYPIPESAGRRWSPEAVSRSGYPEAKVYIQITRGVAPRDHVLAQPRAADRGHHGSCPGSARSSSLC